MKFDGSTLALTAQDIRPDQAQRQLYKGMMNSVIGKFSQRSSFQNTQYVSQAQDIEDLVLAGADIADFQTISDDICEVQTTPTSKHEKNRKTNPIITAFVTSLSRIEMHQNILLLNKSGCCPYYTDTDSLIFSAPKHTTLPFELNGGLGYFKPEYKTPLNGFCCIGKKSYAISSYDNKTETKICGLSLGSKGAKETVTFEDLEMFLLENVPLKKVPQTRTNTKIADRTFSVHKAVRNINVTTSLNFSRILRNGKNGMFTTPYGFNGVEKKTANK